MYMNVMEPYHEVDEKALILTQSVFYGFSITSR